MAIFAVRLFLKQRAGAFSIDRELRGRRRPQTLGGGGAVSVLLRARMRVRVRRPLTAGSVGKKVAALL